MDTSRDHSTPPLQDQHRPVSPSDAVPSRDANDERPVKKTRHASTPPPTSRFVGDLNPEASMIVEAQTERAPSRDRHSLGIWLERGHDQRDRPEETRDGSHEIFQPPTTHSAGLSPESSFLLPDHANQIALFDIYFSRFHPVLPILDEDQFRKELASGAISPTLIQSICLVISRDARAEAHLFLPRISSAILSPSQFSSHLHDDLNVAIATKRERNTIRLIQSLALISLHTDSGPCGPEDASMHLAHAIHHAQTIGLHLGRAKGHRRSYDKLFWCLWCLSILNAASNGRPRSMSEQDIGLKVEDILEFCHPAFRIMASLSQLMERVIRLYQPTSDPEICGLDHDFPSFEIIVERNHGWEIEASTMTILELFYHAISIVSYRTRSTDDIEMAQPSLSSLRQALGSQQVMRILNHTPIHLLLTFPMVPYAVSLALSQTYRQFRQSRSVTKRAIAEEQLEAYVHALESMSDRFQSALTMGAIGRKVLNQIRLLHQTVARQAAVASDAHETEIHDNQQKTQAGPTINSVLGNEGTMFAPEQNMMYGNADAFGDFDGLFAEDSTLQAMDTVFDNFMGMDLPNELFNASLTDDAFAPDFSASQ